MDTEKWISKNFKKLQNLHYYLYLEVSCIEKIGKKPFVIWKRQENYDIIKQHNKLLSIYIKM